MNCSCFRFVLGCIYTAVVIMIVVDLTVYSADPYNLVSISGVAVYLILLFIFSVNPSKVGGRHHYWLQVIMMTTTPRVTIIT